MIRPALLRTLLVSITLVTLITASAAFADTVNVRFLVQGQLFSVQRPVPDGMNPAEAAVRALVAGPTETESALGIKSDIPAGTAINYVVINNDVAEVDMSAPVRTGLTEASLASIFEQFKSTLGDFPEILSIKLTSGGNSLASYLPATQSVAGVLPAVLQEPTVSGVGLAGKKIAVGPSHGRFWNGDGWYWQRALTCGWGEAALEDLLSIRLVTFLKQYLTQDGATFITPRQMDQTDGFHPVTGLHWWKMCAQSWLQHSGVPSSIWANSSGNTGEDPIPGLNRSSDDIRARPLWADYNSADIYIAHHTNAGGTGNATGTETFRDTQMEHPEYEDASLNLANNVQSNIISAIRTTFDEEPSWADRGVKDSAAGFGEIRIPTRPAVLVELAFHDDCTRDALYMTQDDFFKSVAEWGIYKGICAYFGNTPTWDKYSCEYVSDTIPTTMVPKQVYDCSVTFRNRGVCWYSTRGFRLAGTANNDIWFKSAAFVPSTDNVKPGETCTFNFQLTGPCVGGVRTTEWRMVRNGFSTGFGPTVTKVVDAGTVVDTDPPTVPQNLRVASRNTVSVTLEWDASSDAITEVSGYTVYRDGVAIATVTGTTHTVTGMTQNESHVYEVDAFDAFDNRSAKSAPLEAATLPDGDPPTVPANLHTTAVTAKNVALAWDASTDNVAVTGYTVYRDGASIATTAGTTYNDTAVAQSTSYTYQVDAYDAVGNRSEKSSPVAADTLVSANWGPYNLTQSRCIYFPSNVNASLTTGWYTTTAGTGAARSVLKATNAQMNTMPAQSLVSGATFTVAFTRSGTYSSAVNNPLNIYKLNTDWSTASVLWDVPWTTAGGDYSSVGTAAQDCVYPATGTIYTFTPTGSKGWFPYGVMMKGNVETSISTRKKWLNASPSPTLTVAYTPPTPTIRTWAYLGHYAQGVEGDHVTRINTDHVAGTYNGIPVTEANIAPAAADGVSGFDFGNSYGTFKWKTGTAPNDIVNLLLAPFYNAAAVDNGATYAACYVHRSTATGNVYLRVGSDDDVKAYVNGTLVGSYTGASGRGAVADQDVYGPFSLPTGWSRLLLKVENGGGGYGLYARLANIDRTEVDGITTYTSDATAPTNPTDCTEAGGAVSGTWVQTVSSPSFSWSGAADPQGTGEGVSGIRGYKVYFGNDPEGVPATFQSGATFAPGTVADGIYYLRVITVDYALNESAATTLFTFKKDSLVSGAKSLANSQAVLLTPVAVTALVPDGFYVEETDRSAGIKVLWSGDPVDIGDVVRVAGSLGTDASFERQLTATTVTPEGTGSVEPVVMTNKSIGGADWNYNAGTGAGQRGVIDGVGLNNIGLFVRTSGMVAAAGLNYIIVNDGSGARGGTVTNGIRVMCPGLTKPSVGQNVVVDGISTIENVHDSLYRCMLVTKQDWISIQ